MPREAKESYRSLPACDPESQTWGICNSCPNSSKNLDQGKEEAVIKEAKEQKVRETQMARGREDASMHSL